MKNTLYNTPAAKQQLAKIFAKILETKWYEFRKRNKIYREAKEFAVRNNIKY